MQGLVLPLLLLTLLQSAPQISTLEELATALQSASEQQQEQLLTQYSNLVTPEFIKILINQGYTMAAKSDFEGATKAYHAAEKAATRIDDKTGIAAVIMATGALELREGHNQSAMDLYGRAMEMYREANDDRGFARALSNIAAVQRMNGDYKEAMATEQQAIESMQKNGDKEGLANAWTAVAVLHSIQGNYKEAIPIYENALKTFEELGNVRSAAMTLNNLGNVYRLIGNYGKAIEYYLRALDIKTDDKKTIAAVYNGLGILYSQQGNNDLSLEYFRKSLAIKQELGNQALINHTLSNIAATQHLQGDHLGALDTLQKVLNAGSEDKTGTASVFQQMAHVFLSLNQPEQALSYCEKSLSLFESLGDPSEVVNVLNVMTPALIQLDQKEKALETAKRSVALAGQIGSFQSSWEAQTELGKAYVALNRPGEAEAAFQEAVQNVEMMRRQVAGAEEEQEQFMENKAGAYEALVDLRVQQEKVGEALETAELMKGRVLSDILQHGRIDIDKEMTSEEKESERELRQAIVILNQKLLKADSEKAEDLAALQINLKDARLKYEDFRNALFTAHPHLEIQRFEVAPVSVEELTKKLLTPENALLEYAVTEHAVYVFVLTKEKPVQSLRLAVKPEGMRDSVTQFLHQLANRDPGFMGPASGLYRNLLLPIEDRLRGKKKLILVPDSFLWELPFQALRSASGKYLLQDFAISYAPSLNVLYQMSRSTGPSRTASAGSLLAFGNPELQNQQIEEAKLVYRDASLVPLPDSETEVRRVAEFYPPNDRKIHVGREAREDYFKQEAPGYNVLHLATHAILNDASPLYSQLILTPNKAGDQDGLLEPWELMNMNLHAQLVVLSACETARGRVGAGEGMIDLTWSFFVAGAPTTVATQWKVASSSTSELMVQFHRNLKRAHLDPATALQRAALQLLHKAEYSHPFYWAPFVVIGRS